MRHYRFSFSVITILIVASLLLVLSGYWLTRVYFEKPHVPIVISQSQVSIAPLEKAKWLTDVETMQMTVHYQHQQLEQLKLRFNTLWSEENKFVMMGHISQVDNDAFITNAMHLRKLIVQYEQQLNMIERHLKGLQHYSLR